MRKLEFGYLAETLDDLEEALGPILAGDVPEAAVDTETTEVLDDRFTAYASPTRIAGFSVSYGDTDVYAAVRHTPYDWRRRRELIERDTENNGAEWVRRLLEVEHVTLPGDSDGWTPSWAGDYNPNLKLEAVRDLWRRMFAVPDMTWLAHNWPFDSKQFDVEGVELPWERMECTQSMSVFTDPRPLDKWDPKLRDGKGGFVHGGHGLKHLGEAWLNIPADQQKLLGEAKAALGAGGALLQDYSMLPLVTAVAPYGCMDTRLVLNFAAHVRTRDSYKDPAVRELIRKHTLEREVFVDMERLGMPVDKPEAERRAASKDKEVNGLVGKACRLAGMELKLNHGETLANQLYDSLGIPTYRGQRNTRGPALKQIIARLNEGRAVPQGALSAEKAVEVLQTILDYRKAHKELTAFYRPLTYFGDTGRIHTVLRPVEARTTRAAAQKPNAMQMSKPKKDKDPEVARANQIASVRHLFKPDPDTVFLACDFGQQELRVASHYSLAVPEAFDYRFTWNCTLAKRGDCKGKAPHGPPDDVDACRQVTHVGYRKNYAERPARLGLAEGFLSGEDFDPHQAMVGTLEERGVPIDRDQGKTGNFAILYGAFPNKVAETLDCSHAVAKEVFDIFWDVAYPELGHVRDFIGERLRRAGKAGAWSHQDFIRTLHGGRIYLDGGFKGFNYLIQRSCREILLNAILGVHEYTARHAPMYKPVLPVHDELIFQVPKQDLDQAVVQQIARIMVSAGAASRIPMVVEPNVCTESWAIKEPLPGWGWDGVNQGVLSMDELTA